MSVSDQEIQFIISALHTCVLVTDMTVVSAENIKIH